MGESIEQYAHKLQIALTGLAGGGSELFTRHGEDFRADIPFCVARVRERHASNHDTMISFARRANEAEARARIMERVLEEIRDQDWVENCLDPQWASHLASAALKEAGLDPTPSPAVSAEDGEGR